MTTKLLSLVSFMVVLSFSTVSIGEDSIPPELECVTKGNCSASCPGGGKR